MVKPIDITGQHFGRLIAVREVEHKNGLRHYLCHCDCGNEKILTVRELRSGHTKSCGCLRNRPSKNRKNLAGLKFGHLTVLYLSSKRSKDGRAVWHCQCSCGTMINIDSKSLLSGNTTSCGCKSLENKQRIDKLKEAHRINGILASTLKSKVRADNKTGVKGVYFNKRQEKYVAQIQVGKEHIYLGAFAKLQDAAEARKEAEEKYFKPILDKENK